ncbi:NYN domain-containing protein, partial [Klebsiella pneumoniae]
KTDRTTVWKLEEKQTDVRMALEMYRDAIRGEVEQLVLCTNDSDMIPPIEMIKADRPELKIGIVVPREQDTSRVISNLASLGDWSLPYVSYEALRLALLPDKVPTRRKPILKPNHW